MAVALPLRHGPHLREWALAGDIRIGRNGRIGRSGRRRANPSEGDRLRKITAREREALTTDSDGIDLPLAAERDHDLVGAKTPTNCLFSP